MRFESLTEAQTAALSRIAVGLDAGINPRVAQALVARGYVETYPERDGIWTTIRYRVPIAVHIRWAAWCAGNEMENVFLFGEEIMSQNAVKRLYLMQVGSMPEYQIPIVGYLVQTDDGKNILIDSGLPTIIPEDQRDFVNDHTFFEQLSTIGLQPDDIDVVISTHYDFDHAGNHAAFTKAKYVVQRAHHEHAPGNPRYADTRSQWDQPMERIRLVDGDTELLPGLALIETSGHVPGHQSVLVRLPKTGAVLLTIDAVPFRDGFVRDLANDGSNPDAEAIRASTNKLLDLVEREKVGLVIFGHDAAQWQGLKKLPEYYA